VVALQDRSAPSLGENLAGDAVAVEGARGACVGLDLDERFHDLFGGDSVVKSNAQLASQWLERAEYGRR
jgi:hypothetical protein